MSSPVVAGNRVSASTTDTARDTASTGGLPSPASQTKNPRKTALLGVLGLNLSVFALWRMEPQTPQLGRVLRDHAMCSLEHLRSGRLHTLLLSCASHRHTPHFLVNCYGLAIFGNIASEKVSPLEFTASLAVSSVGATISHVAACYPRPIPVLGASGALMGLVSFGAALDPQHSFRMLLPVPGLTLSLLQVADLTFVVNAFGFLALRRRLSTVAWASHLGGTLTGLATAAAFNWRGDKRFCNFIDAHSQQFFSDWSRTADSAESAFEVISEASATASAAIFGKGAR